jgi:hypothetical protein
VITSPGSFHEREEHLQRLVAEPEADPALQELAGGRVELEHAESDRAPKGAVGHGWGLTRSRVYPRPRRAVKLAR